jgi:hypothetical protein
MRRHGMRRHEMTPVRGGAQQSTKLSLRALCALCETKSISQQQAFIGTTINKTISACAVCAVRDKKHLALADIHRRCINVRSAASAPPRETKIIRWHAQGDSTPVAYTGME